MGARSGAVIFDFDDTLAPDSTSQLLAALGVDPHERWGRAWGFIEDGRALNVSPTDFRQGSSAEMVLRMALQSIEEKILLRGD